MWINLIEALAQERLNLFTKYGQIPMWINSASILSSNMSGNTAIKIILTLFRHLQATDKAFDKEFHLLRATLRDLGFQ